MTIAPVDWAAEWLRPVTPNFKLVGSVLAGPGKPLPAHLEVTSFVICPPSDFLFLLSHIDTRVYIHPLSLPHSDQVLIFHAACLFTLVYYILSTAVRHWHGSQLSMATCLCWESTSTRRQCSCFQVHPRMGRHPEVIAVSVQAFMSDQEAREEGVVLASLGTIAELSKHLIELKHLPSDSFQTLPLICAAVLLVQPHSLNNFNIWFQKS